MSILLNIIWILFGGAITGLLWPLFGLILCITVVGVPFGIASFRIAKYVFFPFGNEIVPAE